MKKVVSGAAAATAVEISEMVDGVEHMQRLVQLVLNEEGKNHAMLDIGDGTEILMESGGHANYELRHHECGFMVNSVRGKIPPNQFKGMIRASLLSMMSRLRRSQAGDWRFVACSLRMGFKTRTKRVKISGATDTSHSSPTTGANGIPQQNKQKSSMHLAQEPQLILEFALAEMSHMDPVDPLFEERGVRMGNMYKYAESKGEMRYLPRSLRRQRQRADLVIRHYYGISEDFVGRTLDEDAVGQIEKLVTADFEPEAIAEMLRLPTSLVEQAIEEVSNDDASK